MNNKFRLLKNMTTKISNTHTLNPGPAPIRTDSPPGNTCFVSWTSRDLHNVFFWGVAFLNALVQVTLASYEL
jgi:hypothetical protein